MTVTMNTAAASGINKFLWNELQGIGWTTIENQVPITAPQQEPEFNNSTKPYIVFNWTRGPNWRFELKEEKIAYLVRSTNITEVVEAYNLIIDLFDRYDWSAQDINDWLHELVDGGPETNGSTQQKKYEYKEVCVEMATAPEPATSEGGRYEATVVISVTYTIPLGDRGRRT